MPIKRILKTLIIGGDGLIGRSLRESLIRSGIDVVYTTRRPDSDGFFLDLSDLPDRLDLPKVDCAVICAGIGSVEECETNPGFTYRVNTAAPKRIIQEVASQGGKTIFLSSTHVFDGKTSFYKIENIRNSITNYGRQKAKVEAFIERYYEYDCAIVRLTKVFPKEGGILQNWLAAWKEGRSINAFQDLRINPVSLEFTVAALTKIVTEGLTKKFHISSDMETSYYQFAKSLASLLGYSEDLVAPASAIRTLNFNMPEHSSLASSFNEIEINGKTITNKWSDFMKEIAMNLSNNSVRKPL